MSVNIIEAIDRELEQLQRVRAMLADTSDTMTKATAALPGKRRGRPAGSKNLNTSISPLAPATKKRGRARKSAQAASLVEPVKAKRVMSDLGKARIAAAQKKRWASAKRAAKKAEKEAQSSAAAKTIPNKAAAKKATAKKAVAKKAVAKKVPAKKTVAKAAAAGSTPSTESQSNVAV